MSYVRRRAAFELDRGIADVFPLFTPEGEKLWAPGWDYQNVMGSAELSEDYVFLTESHDHGDSPAIWLVKRFKPEQTSIQYYRIEPNDKVGVVSVGCQRLDKARTQVSVEYAYLPLSSRGRQFLEHFTETAFAQFIAEWEAQLNAYFEASS